MAKELIKVWIERIKQVQIEMLTIEWVHNDLKQKQVWHL